jgi:capsular polysaccharide biosynthesis protein
MTTTSASIRSLGRTVAQVFPSRDVELPNICVFSNAPPLLRAKWAPAYAARSARPEDVSIIALPPGAEVSGEAGFATRIGSMFVAEQLTRDDPVDAAKLVSLFDANESTVEMGAETLLIARYGEGTWGHWLVELLPKIASCETVWPGRFLYAVPQWVLQGGLFSDRILESMVAYGVTTDRLVQIRSDQIVRFQHLYAVTPVFSDMIPHPDVIKLMAGRSVSKSTIFAAKRRIALIRHDARRSISNLSDVIRVLNQYDFELVNIAEQTYERQRALFSQAGWIFSVLGSGLSGLIFSPPGTRVLAAAPTQFADRFFYGILQCKPDAKWAEVRGPIREPDPVHLRDSSFEVPITELRDALHALGA